MRYLIVKGKEIPDKFSIRFEFSYILFVAENFRG
jgi:hypothetical protein